MKWRQQKHEGAHQLIVHSARYSNATNAPITAQYMASLWSSGSDRGRRDKALKVAKQGNKNANQALETMVSGGHEGPAARSAPEQPRGGGHEHFEIEHLVVAGSEIAACLSVFRCPEMAIGVRRCSSTHLSPHPLPPPHHPWSPYPPPVPGSRSRRTMTSPTNATSSPSQRH